MFTTTLSILAVLGGLLALSEWCVRHTPLRHLGSALLIILLTAVCVNLDVIPAAGQDGSPAVYSALLGPVAQLAIFWLLLEVSLAEIRKAGGVMIGAFLLGSLGTLLGVVVAMKVVMDPDLLGEHFHAVGGMFVGTYTGGSVNFNALATEYDVQRAPNIYLASAAVDNLWTTIWMAATLLVPRLLGAKRQEGPITGEAEDTESIHPLHVGWLMALGGAAVTAAPWCADWLSEQIGVAVPSILVLTTLALVLAQVPLLRGVRGRRVLGMTAVAFFLASIGALCDLSVLKSAGDVAAGVAWMVGAALLVHGVIVFGVGRLLRMPPEVLAVASQANIGGGTSALALARSLGRGDLVVPAILVGALGTALGTYLGVLAAGWLGG